QEAIPFSTISLYRQVENVLIDGAIADEKGKFSISGLKDGQYKVAIAFLGYENLVLEDVQIEQEKSISLGKILLTKTVTDLDEVTITAERTLIEEKVDRMVYNAEQDDLAKGGDAADILRKVPLLQVDLEGNVSLRGTSNIQVLIDNRPSTIMADNVADALSMLPAEVIKKVEVITSPSAKYDAEGSGGIINIITQKNKLEGYYLNVSTGVGLRGSNLGLNGSLRKGKFGLSIGGNGRGFYNRSENTLEQQSFRDGITNTTKQFADSRNRGIYGRYNLSFDYDIDKTQFVAGGVRYRIRSFSNDQLQTTDLFRSGNQVERFFRNIDGTRNASGVDANLDYLKQFRAGQEWSIATLYSTRNGNNNFISDDLDMDEVIIFQATNDDFIHIQIIRNKIVVAIARTIQRSNTPFLSCSKLF
ncbi:MAG: TonB-dependent receptor plug domain-containing protein, partial [Bacteroidota bacterium]